MVFHMVSKDGLGLAYIINYLYFDIINLIVLANNGNKNFYSLLIVVVIIIYCC